MIVVAMMLALAGQQETTDCDRTLTGYSCTTTHQQDGYAKFAESMATLKQNARLRKVAQMVKAGDCTNALLYTLDQGDETLYRGVLAICQSRGWTATPAPAVVPPVVDLDPALRPHH